MSENKMPDRIFLSAEAIMDFAINDATEAYKERDDCFPTEYIRADLVPKWNKSKNGLPEKNGWYQVAVIELEMQGERKYTSYLWYDSEEKEWNDLWMNTLDSTTAITHWRERPEYPTEGI